MAAILPREDVLTTASMSRRSDKAGAPWMHTYIHGNMRFAILVEYKWNTRACVSNRVNIMDADGLATEVAKASAFMMLT